MPLLTYRNKSMHETKQPPAAKQSSPRPTLAELSRHCQKPDHRRVGNWMACWIARPLALLVTWAILPAGISAHTMTLLAWLTACCSAAAFAWGSSAGWVMGAILLQLWYLLDHVDGQLARYQGTASLDGATLDYLMHHWVNLTLPLAIGWGLYSHHFNVLWFLLGLSWGLGALFIGLYHDARYKSFIQRLKRVDGILQTHGGGGGRPTPPASVPWREPARWPGYFARKLCEPHVQLNLLTLTAFLQLYYSDSTLVLARLHLLCLSLIAPTVSALQIRHGLLTSASETEFSRWHTPPSGHTLHYQAAHGTWTLHPSRSPNSHAA